MFYLHANPWFSLGPGLFFYKFTMRYEFAHKITGDWSFEELELIHNAQAFVGSPIIGDPVIEIGRFLAKTTGVKYVLIGRFIQPGNDRVQTICFFNKDQQLNNFSYSLKNTPCYGVYQQHVCYYPYGVQEEFPEDSDLVVMGVNSYLGSVLKDYSGNSIGLVVLLNDQTIENPGMIDYLLNIVSPALEKELAEKFAA